MRTSALSHRAPGVNRRSEGGDHRPERECWLAAPPTLVFCGYLAFREADGGEGGHQQGKGEKGKRVKETPKKRAARGVLLVAGGLLLSYYIGTR